MSFLTGKKLSSCHSVNLPNGFRSSIGRHVSGEVRSLERDSKNFGNNCATAQCVLCKVYFSAQLNKLRPILKFKKYYPIENIFVPACSSARKIHFFKF